MWAWIALTMHDAGPGSASAQGDVGWSDYRAAAGCTIPRASGDNRHSGEIDLFGPPTRQVSSRRPADSCLEGSPLAR